MMEGPTRPMIGRSSSADSLTLARRMTTLIEYGKGHNSGFCYNGYSYYTVMLMLGERLGFFRLNTIRDDVTVKKNLNQLRTVRMQVKKHILLIGNKIVFKYADV